MSSTACARSVATPVVTYDLRRGAADASTFYRTLSAFADRVLPRLEMEAGELLSAYATFVTARGEEPRDRGEYAVELLTLGVSWLRYGDAADRSPRAAVEFGIALCRMRSSFPCAKPLLDPLRGWLSSRYLLPRSASGGEGLTHDGASFRRLLRWLEASGEFRDEVKRLRNWHSLGAERGPTFLENACRTAVRSARWFAATAERELGPYTVGVARFLREEHPSYVNREDRIFCGKAAVEYHLSMLSSELTNRGLRSAFREAKRKIVLLPGCMRRRGDGACEALRTGADLRCRECSDDCAIGRITKLGRMRGFETLIIPHSSGFTRSLLRFRDSTEEGVVAVACALNIVPGGYEMRELRIPSQCVLLDYCGCRRHWHPRGIPTDISDERLLAILEASSAPRGPVSASGGSSRRTPGACRGQPVRDVSCPRARQGRAERCPTGRPR